MQVVYDKELADFDRFAIEVKGILQTKEDVIELYLKLRKYGTCERSGFGIGFERLLMYITGMKNIRDVIPYPRTYGSCEY